MCKIIRHGTGKSTQYDIVPNINPQEYNEQNYPIIPDAFKDFSVLGRMVMDKSAEEIMEFMRVGAFPEKPSGQNVNTHQQPVYPSYQQTQTYTQPSAPGAFGENSPFDNQPIQQNLERPVRY